MILFQASSFRSSYLFDQFNFAFKFLKVNAGYLAASPTKQQLYDHQPPISKTIQN